MDLRREPGKHLRNDYRRPPERHALLSLQDSRRSGATARRLCSLDERATAQRRLANSQRRHERASLRGTHEARNPTTIESTATMIETRNTTLKICAALGLVLSLSACGGIDNALNPSGPQAENLSRLWWLFFIVCSVVFVLVMIAMFLSLRNRTGERPAPPVVEPPPE